MNILGTMYLIDEKHIDVLKRELSITPPPAPGIPATGSILCMDMDETTNELEEQFPYHCQKATLLCPPPLAMFKEIDGDQEGFIQAYNEYLEYDDSVQEFIAVMLMFMHVGGNILLYTPAFLEDDSIWTNTLILFFFTRYGITIGTSETNPANYDPSYDGVIADLLYKRGLMDVFDFVNSSSSMIVPSTDVQEKMCIELAPYCGPEENPLSMYAFMKDCLSRYGVPVLRPAVTFDR